MIYLMLIYLQQLLLKHQFYCVKITTIKLTETLTHIGNYAFYRCKNLTTITLPKTLIHIGDADDDDDDFLRIRDMLLSEYSDIEIKSSELEEKTCKPAKK